MKKLNEKIIEKINSFDGSCSDSEISRKLGISRNTVAKYREIKKETNDSIVDNFSKEEIKKLDLVKNLSPKQIQEVLYYNSIAKKTDKHNLVTENIGHALFGAIGDTHLGSKHCNYEGLNKYYDTCEERGVKTVMHAGDIIDGFNVYKGHTFELAKHSMDEQIQDVVENYPKREGIDTHYILGNHDEARLKLAGYDISRAIDGFRDDLHCLGFYNARIKLNGVDVELQHGGGSNSYARSYKPQKYLENADPKDQPNVFLLGHYHTALYMFYRKIHTFMVGAFQGETLLAKRFKLGNVNGGWIVDITLDGKGGTNINMEFISVK